MPLRRLIAAILLLCFVPASLASALPLVYCLGVDGHRAIELAQNGPRHCVDVRRSSMAEASDKSAASGTIWDCIDLRLVPNAQLSQRTPDPDAVLSGGIGDLSVHVRIPSKVSLSRHEGRRAWFIDNAAVANDQLAALRTIVLLN